LIYYPYLHLEQTLKIDHKGRKYSLIQIKELFFIFLMKIPSSSIDLEISYFD